MALLCLANHSRSFMPGRRGLSPPRSGLPAPTSGRSHARRPSFVWPSGTRERSPGTAPARRRRAHHEGRPAQRRRRCYVGQWAAHLSSGVMGSGPLQGEMKPQRFFKGGRVAMAVRCRPATRSARRRPISLVLPAPLPRARTRSLAPPASPRTVGPIGARCNRDNSDHPSTAFGA